MKICKPTIICPLCKKNTKQDKSRSIYEKDQFAISVECFNYIQHAFVVDLEFILFSNPIKNRMGIYYSENNIDLRDNEFIMKIYKDVITYTPNTNYYETKNNQTNKICFISNDKLNKFLNKYILLFQKIELLS